MMDLWFYVLGKTRILLIVFIKFKLLSIVTQEQKYSNVLTANFVSKK